MAERFSPCARILRDIVRILIFESCNMDNVQLYGVERADDMGCGGVMRLAKAAAEEGGGEGRESRIQRGGPRVEPRSGDDRSTTQYSMR